MRGCADFIRQDKADAGKGYGAFSMLSLIHILRRCLMKQSKTSIKKMPLNLSNCLNTKTTRLF